MRELWVDDYAGKNCDDDPTGILLAAKRQMDAAQKDRDIKRAEADNAQTIYETCADVYRLRKADEQSDLIAAVYWLVRRDGNLDLHETSCNTNHDDYADCTCRIAKVKTALNSAR